ncbi:FHA domain-containing protein, partial [bacterium]|nr:FHA domain-containing protein [candidate division CSSED10-310 bacterium]
MAKLTVFINDRPGRVFRINQTITIGRDSANEVQILDQKVSRRHVTIERRKGFFILRDLGSRNGTYLNDVRVDESELKAGDRIRVGNTFLGFGEEPFLDNAEENDTSDLEIPDKHPDDTFALAYDPRKLIEISESFTERKDLTRMIRLFSDLLTFSVRLRTFDGDSIIYQGIQDIIHDMLSVDRSFIVINARAQDRLDVVAVRTTGPSGRGPDLDQPI